MSALVNHLVKAIRATGRSLDSLGQAFEVNPHVERLQPSTKIVKFGKETPVVKGSFVAPGASVIGAVNIGTKTSVWYGAIVRGDVNTITIGDNVTVGDRAMIHCSGSAGNYPTRIGNNVLIGAGAIVHGCDIADEVKIGEGAQILDGAKVEKHAFVAAGAIVPSGKIVPSGQYWSGIPARFEREVTVAEKTALAVVAAQNADLAVLHAKECAKSWEQVEQDAYDYEQEVNRGAEFYQRLTKEEISEAYGEIAYHQVPGRVLNSPISERR